MASPNPTLRRRQLANRLRELRQNSGHTIDEVAQELLCSPAKISRLETAQRGVSQRDVRDLCRIYGLTDPALLDALMTLAREARQPGWWTDYEDLDLTPFIGLEADASAITEHTTCLIPGLMQTEEYARATLQGLLPRIRREVLEERVDARLRRQRLVMQENPPDYWVLLDESVLRRHIGSRGVMRAQLERAIEIADLPHVTLQVIPFSVGAYMGLDNSFVLLEIADSAVSDVVCIEGVMGLTYLERPAELEKYREVLDHLRASALDPRASLALITEAAKMYAE
jgi:transcriptional regulator with XRE-family HTH domain